MKYLLLIFALVGCENNKQATLRMNQSFISDLSYVKDSYGNCFAVYKAQLPYGLMASVDCEKVGL